jgi:hypothetical protein
MKGLAVRVLSLSLSDSSALSFTFPIPFPTSLSISLSHTLYHTHSLSLNRSNVTAVSLCGVFSFSITVCPMIFHLWSERRLIERLTTEC